MSESTAGRVLLRTWMQSKFRHNPRDLSIFVIRVHETKPHALSHANTETTKQQQAMLDLEREARAEFDKLASQDREILRLSQTPAGVRECRLSFMATKVTEQEQAGWTFLKWLKNGTKALMWKNFQTTMTHAEIAEQLQLSIYQVRRRLSSMSRPLVKFAVLRGWV